MARKRHATRRPAATRRRAAIKREVVRTRRIVHEKPIVIETRRVVERRHTIGGAPASTRGRRVAKIDNPAPRTKPERGRTKSRVIRADAEVTILGPDRMIIRLFRKKSRGGESSARAD